MKPEGGGDTLHLGVARQAHRGELLDGRQVVAIVDSFPDFQLEIIKQTNGFCKAAVAGGVLDAALVFGKPLGAEVEAIHVGTTPIRLVSIPKARNRERQPTDLNTLVEGPLAYPLDIQYFCQEIVPVLRAQGVLGHLRLSNIEDEMSAYSAFLKTGGQILAIGHHEIGKSVPLAVERQLSAGLRSSLPVYLIFRRQDAAKLLSNIAKSAKQVMR